MLSYLLTYLLTNYWIAVRFTHIVGDYAAVFALLIHNNSVLRRAVDVCKQLLVKLLTDMQLTVQVRSM